MDPLFEEEDKEIETSNGTADNSISNRTTSAISAAIRVLDRTTASNLRKFQIINKVADVVRELVENSIDAGAKTVCILLSKVGLSKIEVRDNGKGISHEDVPLIFAGGHTSKLENFSNLSRGKYFGFRGEALNAMCAIGRVTLTSKTSDENSGRKYEFDGLGSIISESREPHNGGTTVILEKIFERTPVRRNYLENKTSASNELKDIETFLKGVALSNPTCHISFYHDSNLIWSKASVQSTRNSLMTVLGHGMAKKMEVHGPFKIEVDNEEKNEHPVRSIELCLPTKPVDMRAMSYTSNKMSMIFCNRKRVFIREYEKLLHHYITSVVEKPQPADRRRFPIFLLFIQLPPEEVDFNRDTDKAKVFLIHKEKVREAIEKALIDFYEIDLRNCEENVRNDGTNSAKTPAVTDSDIPPPNEKDVVLMKDPNDPQIHRNFLDDHAKSRNTEKTTSTLYNSHANQQRAITDFVQKLPSTSSAFSKSPTSVQKNAESVSIASIADPQLPVKQNETNSIPWRKPPAIVSNFEISVDTQLSQLSANTDPTKVCAQGGGNGRSSGELAAQIQNWILDGRVYDNSGKVLESVKTVNNVIPGEKPDEDYQKFRSIIAGTSRNNLPTPKSAPPTPLASEEGPPHKRPKLFSTHSDVSSSESPRHSYSFPGTPNITNIGAQKQNAFGTRWSTPSTVFSQRASETPSGVRIPFNPKTASNNKQIKNSSDGCIPKSVRVFENHQRQIVGKSPTTSRSCWQNATRFLTHTLPKQKWTPKVHGLVPACLNSNSPTGPLFLAQTQNEIGVFSPVKMIKYFPEESFRTSLPVISPNVLTESESDIFSKEEVSCLFLRFVKLQETSGPAMVGKIFHALKDLSTIENVYNSMQINRSRPK